MIQFLQFSTTIKVLWIQPFYALRLKRSYYRVVGVEDVSEHWVCVVNRWRRPESSASPHVLIGVQIYVLQRRQRQRAHLYRFGCRHYYYYCYSVSPKSLKSSTVPPITIFLLFSTSFNSRSNPTEGRLEYRRFFSIEKSVRISRYSISRTDTTVAWKTRYTPQPKLSDALRFIQKPKVTVT